MFLYKPEEECLVHQKLKVNRAQSALAVVNDIFSPNFAFDVDKNTSY